ncbi:DUF4352 domain-containing protein [Planococcus lenghuensis]|uniref:DUF4352 domain-containing protein n=1 Tax=Planococcus lenghuensis TaxID=2213202 RepID=A0A1Q2L4T6_9BACL|nr:DUF4352 domain-containing protein [Planococcus lenghuensis]AQQ55433.1 hypothetical protein B0X71_19925 [Planococcus lenghuensis]
MKFTAFLLSSLLLMTGCSNAVEQSDSGSETVSETKTVAGSSRDNVAKKNIPDNSDTGYVNNPQAPDTRSLNEIGQVFTDEDGTVTLKAITDYQKAHTIGPIQLTVFNIKVVNYSPSHDLIDYFHGFTHSEDNFNYLKLHVTIENTSDQVVDFAPVSILETNEGEKKDFDDDFYLQNLYGQLQPHEVKTGELAFVLDQEDIEHLKSIKIHPSDVFDEQKNVLNPGEIIEIDF